jgi:ATP-dependent protease HslVU (ClpYQ) peptidase subunit
MTCIVAISDKNKIWMGGDSAASKNDEIITRENKKVFKNGNFIIGFSGSFRVGQILQYGFNPPKQEKNQDDMEYMVIDFIDSLRSTLQFKGLLFQEREGDAHDCEFIVGYKNTFYLIESDFQISKPIGNYIACGSGAHYAMGALHALKDIDLEPKIKIEKALNASAEYCTMVRGPYEIISL